MPTLRMTMKRRQSNTDRRRSAANRDQTTPLGNCFEHSARYLMDHGDDPNLVLCHGWVTGTGGTAEGKRYAHAWVERRNAEPLDIPDGVSVHEHYRDRMTREAIDVTTAERFHDPMVLPAVLYRHYGQADNVREYTHRETLRNLVDFEHWGPWHEGDDSQCDRCLGIGDVHHSRCPRRHEAQR